MRSWKLVITAFIAFGAASYAGAGCATTPEVLEEDDSAAPPVQDATADVAKDTSPPKDAPADTAVKDSAPPPPTDAPRDTLVPDTRLDSPAEVSVDSGRLPPNVEGAPCTTPNQIHTFSCGICGTGSQVCLGDNTWSAPGACFGEVVNGCVPGTSVPEPCGLCGTRNVICQPNCTKALGACTGEVAGGCVPGTTDFALGLGCPANLGRYRTCGAACTYTISPTCEPRRTFLEVAPVVGAKSTEEFELLASTKIAKVNVGLCPVTNSATQTSYVFVPVYNNTTRIAVVWLYASSPGSFDTILGAYPGSAEPADRTQCIGRVTDSCALPAGGPTEACKNGHGGLVGPDAVTIQPGQAVIVYVAAYGSAVGKLNVTVYTSALN